MGEEAADKLATLARLAERRPDDPVAQQDLGLALLKAGLSSKTAAVMEAAEGRFPGLAVFPTLAGHAYALDRRLDAASASYGRALAAKGAPPSVWYALGMVERDRGRFAESRECQERYGSLTPDDPEGHFELAQLLLLRGDYRRGFAEYEWRLKRSAAPDRDLPRERWTGTPPHGRHVLLYGEQGMGDVIQMARFVSRVTAMGARVTLSCHPPLVALLSELPGVERVVAHRHEPTDVDLQAPLLSLPFLLGLDLPDVGVTGPYLTVPEGHGGSMPLPGDGLKVGVAWAGSPDHRNDHNRSMPSDLMLSLGRLPGVCLFSLQVDAATTAAVDGAPVVDLAPAIADMADTAALIGRLDLVVCVDTAVAHLAGALAKPVWILLPHIPDWRWMTGREDSPWYPTARLFRQTAPGDWPGVIKRAALALRPLTGAA